MRTFLSGAILLPTFHADNLSALTGFPNDNELILADHTVDTTSSWLNSTCSTVLIVISKIDVTASTYGYVPDSFHDIRHMVGVVTDGDHTIGNADNRTELDVNVIDIEFWSFHCHGDKNTLFGENRYGFCSIDDRRG